MHVYTANIMLTNYCKRYDVTQIALKDHSKPWTVTYAGPCSSLTTLVPLFPLISSTSPNPSLASRLKAFTAPSLFPQERNFLAFKRG